MEAYANKSWITNPFSDRNRSTGISTTADEELVDLSEDSTMKDVFVREKLIQFWFDARCKYSALSSVALKSLIPFATSYLCETGFSSMLGVKSKFRNKLELAHSL